MVLDAKRNDSGVETECDLESNESSVSSPGNTNMEPALPPTSSCSTTQPSDSFPAAANFPATTSSTGNLPVAVSSTSGNFSAVASSSGSTMGSFASVTSTRDSLQFSRPPVRDESLDGSFRFVATTSSSQQMFTSASQLTSEDSSNQSAGGMETSTNMNLAQNEMNPQPLAAEDGYLGDCSSDGGNEKNFPLPADWSSRKQNCSCHTSRHSLPPSPASSQHAQTDTSPPPPPSPPGRMEDMEPPAGLQFSALAQSPENGGSSYSYQLLSPRERNERSLKMKSRLRTGLRSKYNSGVEQDWARIKSAIADRKLRMAASSNNSELVERLCLNGANVRCFDEHKRTPLHFAASMGYTEVADILIKHGADPNQKDKLGNTALHLAACTSHVPVVTLLLRAGTDITTIDNNGRTPMQLASAKLKILQRSSSTHTEMVQVKSEVSAVLDMMREYLKKVLQSRDTARTAGNPEAFSQLIESFSQRLNLHTTHSDLSTDLGNLLESMGTLSLNKSAGTT